MAKSREVKVLRFPSSSEEASEGREPRRVIIEVHHYHHYPSPRQAQARPVQRPVQTARRRGFWDRVGAWWNSIPPASRVAMVIVLAALLTL